MGLFNWFKKKPEKITKNTKEKNNKNLKELNSLAEEIERQSKDIGFQDRLKLGDLVYLEIYSKHYPEDKKRLNKKDEEWTKYKEYLKKTDQIREYESWEKIDKNKKGREEELKNKYNPLLQKLIKYAELMEYIPPKNRDADTSKFLPKKFLEIKSWEQEDKSVSEKVAEDILKQIDWEEIDKTIKEAKVKENKKEKERAKKLKEKLLQNKIRCDFCKSQIQELKKLGIEKERIYCLDCWDKIMKKEYNKEWNRKRKEEIEKLMKRGLSQKEITLEKTKKRAYNIIKLAIVLIPILLIGYVIYANFLASHDFNYFYDIGSKEDLKRVYLIPTIRVSDIINNSYTYRNISHSLVYFDVPIPRGSNSIKVDVRFKDNFPKNSQMKLGAKNGTGWNYNHDVLYNQSLFKNTSNQWVVSSTNFNVKDLYTKDNKLSMLFVIPHLNKNETKSYTIPVDWINISIHKNGFFKS